MENKYSKQIQKSLKSQIKQVSSLNPAGVILFTRHLFDFNRYRSFFVAVAENARLRYKKIISEFIEMQQVKEELTPIYRASIESDEIDKYIDMPFHGETIAERLTKLGIATSERVQAIFERGMKSGLGYKAILADVQREIAVGGFQLERIIRTEGQRISNAILFSTYNRNRKYIGGIMYQATLDVRTCETCGHYDRNEYWYEGTPSVGKAPFLPLHPMCRCVYVPISAEWKKYKVSRASSNGYVDTDYKSWLKSAEINDPGFAKPILGKNYDSWKQGTYEVSAKLTPELTYRNYLKG